MCQLTKIIYKGEIFKIESYISESGKNFVVSWLESRPEKEQVKFLTLFARLADHGRIYNEKKFKHLIETKQLFEFKVGNGRIISFFFFGKRVVLTHGFAKRGNKTPKREIEKAEKIQKEFQQRINDEKN